MLITRGTQERILRESPTQAGSISREGSINSDSLLATLWVDAVTSGTLSVSVYTLTDNGKEVLLFSFPSISAGTTDLLLKKSGVSMQRFRIQATYTGECSYEIYVRAIEGAGESNVKIIGSASLYTSSSPVTSTPAVLIPAALTDRNGMTIKNYSGGSTLFVSEDITKLPLDAWPITSGEVWSMDVGAGVTIYAVSASNPLDVRIAESGT